MKRPVIVAALRANPNASQVVRQIRGLEHLCSPRELYVKVRKIAKAEGIKLEGQSWRRQDQVACDKGVRLVRSL